MSVQRARREPLLIGVMDRCLIWNIRGLNRPQKQKEVFNFLCKNRIGIACLVETKIKNESFADLYTNVFQG